jgi:hypothetical protein
MGFTPFWTTFTQTHLGTLFQGNYEGRATLYSDAVPDTTLGCVDMTFTFEKA